MIHFLSFLFSTALIDFLHALKMLFLFYRNKDDGDDEYDEGDDDDGEKFENDCF